MKRYGKHAVGQREQSMVPLSGSPWSCPEWLRMLTMKTVNREITREDMSLQDHRRLQERHKWTRREKIN